jgi:hypothetical protein
MSLSSSKGMVTLPWLATGWAHYAQARVLFGLEVSIEPDVKARIFLVQQADN